MSMKPGVQVFSYSVTSVGVQFLGPDGVRFPGKFQVRSFLGCRTGVQGSRQETPT